MLTTKYELTVDNVICYKYTLTNSEHSHLFIKRLDISKMWRVLVGTMTIDRSTSYIDMVSQSFHEEANPLIGPIGIHILCDKVRSWQSHTVCNITPGSINRQAV